MNPHYTIADTSAILSPGLLFYKELIQRNIERCLQIAGFRATRALLVTEGSPRWLEGAP